MRIRTAGVGGARLVLGASLSSAAVGEPNPTTSPGSGGCVARVEVKHKVDSPQNLVRYAKKIFNNEEYDAVWCVVDVDQFDVDAAKRLAREKSVELAVSEPCFELWLLLHFTDRRAYRLIEAKRG